MKKIIIFVLALLLFANFAQAQEQRSNAAISEAYLRYKTVGWQTYEFYVLSNIKDENSLTIEWTVDEKDTFTAPKLHYFLKAGEHTIRVRVEDRFGNIRYDKIKLDVHFWSLQDNWFWWVLYLLLILIVLYYWTAKIIYILNRRKVSKEVRYFLDSLDEHGWVERSIEAHFGRKARVKSS
jgi:hypothetical protein